MMLWRGVPSESGVYMSECIYAPDLTPNVQTQQGPKLSSIESAIGQSTHEALGPLTSRGLELGRRRKVLTTTDNDWTNFESKAKFGFSFRHHHNVKSEK
ncbi:hypothetical protein CEXT_458751 [Caerostris extrusa]|uniref:Uncharacterized protein n=1 Tax=Caerostris extrusa TaxID=172846 RepID=A0AAV4UHZ4_CAEEX|nr:hypothetical protein CEXT_458751 [Caerostris extrusa]